MPNYDDRRDQRDRHAVSGDVVPDDAIFFREHYPWGANVTYRLPNGDLWYLCRDFDETGEQVKVYWVKTYRDMLAYVLDNWAPVLESEFLEKERMRREYERLASQPTV